jgi:isochorismate synthase
MVLYSQPGSDEYRFYEAADGGVLEHEDSDYGFFYAPFAATATPQPRLLQPAPASTDVAQIAAVEMPESTSPAQHAEHVAMLSAHHAAKGGGKTVYARRISNAGAHVDWAAVADEYFRAFPQTFRFIFATPSDGCWLGATPELLLQRKAGSGKLTTMALAGTLRNDTDRWDAKNIEEHNYVTRFIVDTFARFGIKAEVSPAEDVRFGAIRHLCHRISAEYSGPIVPLLNALSPTPALSGFPREEALDMIGRVESPRSLYGGYVGINSADGICAYVNLRSMCFNPDGGYCIYSGGGITSQSDTADEWLETEAKSAVLRRCIANHTFTSAKPTHTTPNDSESSSTPSL